MPRPRPQEPGSLHAAIAAAFAAAGVARAAHAMQVGEPTLSRYTDPGENGLPVHVQRLAMLAQAHPAAAAPLAEFFAAHAGLCVVEPETRDQTVSQAAAAIAGNSASVISLVLAAQADQSPGGRRITCGERAAIRAAAQSLLDAGQALDAALAAVDEAAA